MLKKTAKTTTLFVITILVMGGQNIIVLVVLIIAAVGAMMLQLAISRQRELYADEHGAKVNNSSEGLISALMKLES